MEDMQDELIACGDRLGSLEQIARSASDELGHGSCQPADADDRKILSSGSAEVQKFWKNSINFWEIPLRVTGTD